MNKQINPVVIVAVLVALVAVLGYFGYRAATPPTPAPGSYTPGVPPWLDKAHPNAAEGVHPAGAGAPAPTAGAQPGGH